MQSTTAISSQGSAPPAAANPLSDPVAKSLLEAERYAEWILNSVGEGLCRVDDAGLVTFINPMGAMLLGYQPQEMVGKNAQRLFHYAQADGRPYPQEECRGWAALQQGRPNSVDHEVFWRKDGSSFPVHYVSAPMVADGEVRGTVVTFRDTSQEVSTRKALIENEIKMRKAQEIAGFGIYVTDLTTGTWESSAQLDALLGLDEHFVHDVSSWTRLISEDFRQPVRDHLRDVTEGRCDFRMDYRIIRPLDGESRWVTVNGEVERDEQGKPLRLIGSIQDITERKRIEAALQQSHDLLNKLSEEVPGALYQFKMHADGRFSAPFASRGVLDMFGVRPEEIRDDASKIFEAIPLTQRDSFVQSVLQSANTLQNWVEVFQVDLPQQGGRWRQGQARPERQADGSILWHGFIADATDRVEAGNQLLHLNETLESRVLERTRELASALDSAELAKRSRGEFLANMSHEIRTPMNTVMGMVHLALKTRPAPVVQQYLEKIQQSSAHLLTMINDILDFSKIDAGKLQLELSDFRVEETLQHIIQLTEGRAIEKGLSLRLELEPSVPQYVRGDALRISQILINYLNNAIKFTTQGRIVLRVRAPRPGQAGHSRARCLLHFEVEDTGIGVAADQGQRLFESFEQGDNSTTRKFGGTGLGLAISRQLATLMGGTVGVFSQPGVGSTFWFEASLDIASEPDYASMPRLDVDGAIQALRGKRVLVVDDNDFNLEVARGLLQDAAVHVEVARDGKQAIAALLQSPFDCVLMDVQMPLMDGLEATCRIRRNPTLGQMVVIAMTANAGQEDRSKCLAAGMNEVIIKPVEPDALFLTLARWVGSAATPQPEALPVWDASALSRIVGNNLAAHARLLNTYRTSARETVAVLLACAAQGRWSDAADQAHKLKSSSRSVGAMHLGGLCEALERAGRSANAPACGALVQSVAAAFAEVLTRIPPPAA